MTYATRRFDDVLSNINADELKSMVRLWGGLSTFQKLKCITLIQESLNDPQKIEEAVARLAPFEHAHIWQSSNKVVVSLTCRHCSLGF